MAKKKVVEENPGIVENYKIEPVEQGELPGVFLEPVEDKLPPKDSKEVPKLGSPDWQDYVMSHFAPSELVEGNPRTAALQRVATILLGDIISNETDVTLVHDGVTFAKNKCSIRLHAGVDEYLIVSDVACCSMQNTPANYAVFAAETASTRALGRTLRKALQLSRIAAEEMNQELPKETNDGEPVFITDTQINLLDMMCNRNNIDVLKYINSGESKYSKVEEVPYDVAKNMVRWITECQKDQSKIKPEIKGYDKGWKN